MVVNEKNKTMRRVGAWCIVMGVTSIVVGVSVGVGCLIGGGNLLGKA